MSDQDTTVVQLRPTQPVIVPPLPRWERFVLDFQVLDTWERVTR